LPKERLDLEDFFPEELQPTKLGLLLFVGFL
jgi:hypothetical protein